MTKNYQRTPVLTHLHCWFPRLLSGVGEKLQTGLDVNGAP